MTTAVFNCERILPLSLLECGEEADDRRCQEILAARSRRGQIYLDSVQLSKESELGRKANETVRNVALVGFHEMQTALEFNIRASDFSCSVYCNYLSF